MLSIDAYKRFSSSGGSSLLGGRMSSSACSWAIHRGCGTRDVHPLRQLAGCLYRPDSVDSWPTLPESPTLTE
jgi:hypothetical protein